MSDPDSIDDRYLWDGSGTPDPDVQRMERTLAPFAYRETEPVRRATTPLRAVAAVLLVAAAVAGALWVARDDASQRTAGQTPSWSVASVAGAPLVGSDVLADGGRLGVGEWLETDERSRARLDVADIGTVEVGPRSRVRLVATRADEHRLHLQRGHIEARISAPPRLFLVETPAALAVDLGCHYTLDVEEDGDGVLRVSTGWVSLERGGRESVVPAGALCAIDATRGPGTPRFEDAPQGLVAALERLDRTADETVLDALLAASREEDSLTLWHLLPRLGASARGRLHDRLAELVEAPEGLAREAVVRLDEDALAMWRDELEWRW